MTFEHWRRGLLIMTLLFGAQALSWTVIGSFDPVGLYDRAFAQWLFGLDSLPPNSKRTFAFVLIPFGATTFGYFVLVAMVVHHAFPRRERWAYQAVVWSMTAWFVVDTALCIVQGAWFNVLIVNVPFGIVVGIPLIALRPHFLKGHPRAASPSAD